jgi:hypothetical protein
MVWIFTLGIIGFCIFSAGFRKLVLSLVALVFCISVGVFGYSRYQDHTATEQVARAEAQTKIDAAKYPLCKVLNKDERKAWFNSGGNCRISNGIDPEIEAAFIEQSIAKVKTDKIKYSACDIQPFDALKYSACVIGVDGGPEFESHSTGTSSSDDFIPQGSLIRQNAKPR